MTILTVIFVQHFFGHQMAIDPKLFTYRPRFYASPGHSNSTFFKNLSVYELFQLF